MAAIKDWAQTFDSQRPRYVKYTEKLEILLHDLLRGENLTDSVAQVEARTKSIESFTKKLQLKHYDNPLTEVTDLTGIRVITYYQEGVHSVLNLLRKQFEIDDANSIDVAKTQDPNKFGYISVHSVISLSSSRNGLTEWEDYKGLKAEIQIRTVLQHAWAAIDHTLNYKNPDEAPARARRQLFRLSALLELADEEFSQIRNIIENVEQQYSSQVNRGFLELELDLSSLNAYLTAGVADEWREKAKQAGFAKSSIKDPQAGPSELLDVLQTAGFRTIQEVDNFLSAQKKKGVETLVQLRKRMTMGDFVPIAVPSDAIAFLLFYENKLRDLKKVDLERLTDKYVSSIERVLVELSKGKKE